MGICITSSIKRVLFQNETCQHICGDQLSKTCHQCKDIEYKDNHLTPQAQNNIQAASLVATKQYIGPHLCDIHRHVEKNNQELTVIYPAEEFIKQNTLYFKRKKFTPRELEIGLLLLEKKSNLAIQKTLTISKATLKTHLNHMYQKCPSLKSARLGRKTT